jgi:NAD-dependent SIR2 family protein deacetylase
MCWKSGSFSIEFAPIKNDVDVVINIGDELYRTLRSEVQALFEKTSDGYCYKRLNNSTHLTDKAEAPCPDDQKLVGSGAPTPISITDVAKIIKTKKVIFYTGAGISACCVPTMAPLELDLGITALAANRNYTEFIVNFFKNIDHAIKVMKAFFYNCEYSHPSAAHCALSQIVKKYGHFLYTENIDQLHQKTGLKPVVMPGRKKKAQAKSVNTVQYIITVGLSADDGGFLKYCKQINPSIRIISIDLNQTCYLSSEDFTLIGNVQEILPQLASLLNIPTNLVVPCVSSGA